MENLDLMPLATGVGYEYAVAGRPLGGERQSGDAALVVPTAGGVLLAVVDGLGHGDEAAAAAGAAIAVLREHAGEPLVRLLQHCHERLQPTRGVVLTVAALDAAKATLSWVGVGNVEAVLIGSASGTPGNKMWLTNRNGVVGFRLPALEVRTVPVAVGDLLILATDGIDESFVSDDIGAGHADDLAHDILERHGKATDDALVLVLRWLGGGEAKTWGSPR